MQNRDTQILGSDSTDLAQAAALLRSGGLVSFPTETVYGLGADARLGPSVAKIYAAKDRPSFNPLIVHVPDLDHARRYGHLTGDAVHLAQTFWPGPLTLVLPLTAHHGLSELVTAGLPTVALRIPNHPVARALLTAFDGPVAAPSANPSGKISPTRAQHVIDGLGGRIDAVVDAGPCQVGVESTILGFEGDHPVLLRAGGVPAEEIEDALQKPLSVSRDGASITAPGQLQSHYAPRSTVRLNALAPAEGELYLGFAEKDGDLNLSPTGDLTEAAAQLFAHLHALDALGKPIAVAPVPHTGLGRAINDRLIRAAAPRNG